MLNSCIWAIFGSLKKINLKSYLTAIDLQTLKNIVKYDF